MKIKQLIEDYSLNRAYSFALFGIYALTISPIANNFFEFGQPNKFIACFGFIMLIAEFIALKFKLGVIRVRTQLKRIEYRKETGKDIIPTISSGVLFGFFARLVFHVSVIMVCMTSLGYECMGNQSSGVGVTVVMIGFGLEMAGIIYLYINYDFYTDIPSTRIQFRREIKEDDEWAHENLSKKLAEYSYKKETAANIVLHIFSCMLFTSCWHFINQNGIHWLLEFHFHDHSGATAAFFGLFPILFVTVIIGLLPMQISYWIETSMLAFTIKEKKKNWIIFITVGIFVCAPTIIKYFEIFVFHIESPSTSFPEYAEYLVSLVLFIIILLVEIHFLERNDDPVIENPEINKEEIVQAEQIKNI